MTRHALRERPRNPVGRYAPVFGAEVEDPLEGGVPDLRDFFTVIIQGVNPGDPLERKFDDYDPASDTQGVLVQTVRFPQGYEDSVG